MLQEHAVRRFGLQHTRCCVEEAEEVVVDAAMEEDEGSWVEYDEG